MREGISFRVNLLQRIRVPTQALPRTDPVSRQGQAKGVQRHLVKAGIRESISLGISTLPDLSINTDTFIVYKPVEPPAPSQMGHGFTLQLTIK
jgi:hypothetical protein